MEISENINKYILIILINIQLLINLRIILDNVEQMLLAKYFIIQIR